MQNGNMEKRGCLINLILLAILFAVGMIIGKRVENQKTKSKTEIINIVTNSFHGNRDNYEKIVKIFQEGYNSGEELELLHDRGGNIVGLHNSDSAFRINVREAAKRINFERIIYSSYPGQAKFVFDIFNMEKNYVILLYSSYCLSGGNVFSAEDLPDKETGWYYKIDDNWYIKSP